MTKILINGERVGLGYARDYLEGYFGIPLALREQGTIDVVCPFCGYIHDVGEVSGHQEVPCEEEIQNEIEIEINGRTFMCNYGFTCIEYTKDGELIIPENLE